jgi:ABC-2 type transport system ATP-binding protein
MQPVISLHDISKRFRNQEALKGITLDVPPGVVFAILGENGAGKTTLIRILTGFLKADKGTATVLGHSCESGAMEIRRSIGYVSDAPALYDWMTAEEIGWFTAAFYDDEFPRRYLSLMSSLDVPPATKIKTLSRGQRAKVALALATAHDPKLLILDEPTSGLDPMVRRQFLESMVDRAAQGRTVLLSSHQINEVERVADWIAIIHQGELKLAQPLDVLKQSTSIVTASLDDLSTTVALPPGEVLTETKNGRQMRWIVQNLDDNWQSACGPESGISDVSVNTATLEDIFVAVCDARAARPVRDDLHSSEVDPPEQTVVQS